MKGILKVAIYVRMESGRDAIEIPENSYVELIRCQYLSRQTLESLPYYERRAVESGEKLVFYFKGRPISVNRNDVDIPRFWAGKYNW